MASENGWEPSHATADQLEWRVVPGSNPPVKLQVLRGWAATLLMAWAADYNAYVEHLRDADSASFTPTNSVATSNHLNGTAMDLNWNSHPFHVSFAGYTPQMIATMTEMEEFYEGNMFWAQRWYPASYVDSMHHQCGYDTWNNPKTLDFINRKIRADGFSTFRRGGTVTPPPVVVAPPVPAAVDVLARATGVSQDKANQIITGVTNGLRDSQCNNVNRVAMWLAQMGHESAGFNATEEYASGAAYEGRAGLGNTQPGDGVRFKGRSWIQITGRSNYTALSKWAFSKGIVDSPTFFVDNPTKLALIQYAGLGPAWYWTVARPQINSLSDARNLTAVTQAINGGQNGAADRKTRYDRALALGDQLLTLTTDAPAQGDDMASVPQDQWDRVYHELVDLRQSRSPLRHLGEKGIDTWSGFTLNTDGSQHVEICRVLAGYGHPPTLALLREVAGADPVKFPDRQDDAKIAQAILAEVTAPTSAVAPQVAARTDDTRELADAYAQINRLQAENADLKLAAAQTVAPETLSAPAVLPAAGSDSTGASIGKLYDSLDELRLADALPIESRAPLAALISVLSTKNGSQV